MLKPYDWKVVLDEAGTWFNVPLPKGHTMFSCNGDWDQARVRCDLYRRSGLKVSVWGHNPKSRSLPMVRISY